MRVTKWSVISAALVAVIAVAGCKKKQRSGPKTPPSPSATAEPTPSASAAPVDAAVAAPDAAGTVPVLDGVKVGVVKTGPEPYEFEFLVGTGIPALSADGKLMVRAGDGNAGPAGERGLNLDLVDVATEKVVKVMMVLDRSKTLDDPPLADLEKAVQAANDELAKTSWLPMVTLHAACMQAGCEVEEPFVFTIDTPPLQGTLTWHDPNLTWKPTAPDGKQLASKPKWNPKPYKGAEDMKCTHSAIVDTIHVAPGSKTVLVETGFEVNHACEDVTDDVRTLTLP